ncbi:hypothetical protein VTN31DRAFT_6797 [Thermomyces dupontii]|uniref:uncharacterized protein n=1 Tax=Talaromyces thermophilus TaxID=28565 RepID=UPI00374381E0
MSSDSVLHRRNKQIQDAIDSRNYKQALQLVDKRLKKGEDSRFLRAWRAVILLHYPDDAHREQGRTDIAEITKLDPPITDLDTLELLHSSLREIPGFEDTVRTLWEKAAKAKPQDVKIQSAWFSRAFDAGDWKAAQKAAMSLQVNFPKNRKYYFWAIMLCHIMSVEPSILDAERKLFGTLAYRMISKAAESVPADPNELLSPPRAIQTSEELHLLIQIYESQGKFDEVVKILDSPNLGLSSRIVQNEWSFVAAKLNNLRKTEKWADSLAYARELLTMPEDDSEAQKLLKERDDWQVWESLLSATRNINERNTTTETQAFLDGFAQRFPSRNAQLALLDLAAWKLETNAITPSDMLAACQTYFDRTNNKLYCFGDLRRYITRLEKADTIALADYALRKVDEDSKDTSQIPLINALKLEYCLKLFSENWTREQVDDFVSRCLKAYRETAQRKSEEFTMESQPRDDFCLLAAASIIRSSDHGKRAQEFKSPSTALIRAIAVLNRLLQDSPHNYQALLLLVRLYLLLGAGSLALKTFARLSTKNIQNETVGHNLFTRLATIHPHSAPPTDGDFKDFMPHAALAQALDFYRNADRAMVRQRSVGLNMGSYVNVQASISLHKALCQSICRRLWALEIRRIDRLVGRGVIDAYTETATDALATHDQRTYDAFMNCEAPDHPTMEELVRPGPIPRDGWGKATTLIDRTFVILHSILAQKPVKEDISVSLLDELTLSDDKSDDMTPAEKQNVQVHRALLKIAFLLRDSQALPGEDIEALFGQVEEHLTKALQWLSQPGDTLVSLLPDKPAVPSWTYLHTSFSVLESLKSISLALQASSSKKTPKTGAKGSKETVQRVEKLAREVGETIKSQTKKLRDNVIGSGMLGALMDVVYDRGEATSGLTPELEKTLDEGAVEVLCGDLRESWEEGLGGIFQCT